MRWLWYRVVVLLDSIKFRKALSGKDKEALKWPVIRRLNNGQLKALFNGM